MHTTEDILVHFETHDPEGIRACLQHGLDPLQPYAGQPLVYSLVNMYLRSPRFAACMRAMESFGAVVDDPLLQAVLTNDATRLETMLALAPGQVHARVTLDGTFTPLFDVTLLHVCAEYNHTDCAEVLLRYGADPDAVAGLDAHGFGGHTPVFHTVNQHGNVTLDMLELLLSHGARLDLTVAGLIWGRGYPWETFIPSVNPISYAMMGLLRQFQRTEADVYAVVERLVRARYGIEYRPGNIPNRYLQS
jgi:hypothetical protein